MTPTELEGKSLGEKHQAFNTVVKQTLMRSNDTLKDFDANDPDIENLIKIEVANKKRNVGYILEVLQCNDSLYVSRVLKQCKWIVNEPEYAIIINPTYIYSSLLPQMCSKAGNKLMKFIRLNLKNEARVEEFYNYEDHPSKALCWLPNCSVEFIKANIVRHLNDLTTTQLKRLCERSFSILEIYLDNCQEYDKVKALDATSFLLRKDTSKYMGLTEKYLHLRSFQFGASATKLVLKNDAKLITDAFLKYCNHIHLPTFIKFIKKEDIKQFILKQAIKAVEENNQWIFNKKVIKRFIEAMPDEERFRFIKFIFIDKQFENETKRDDEKEAYSYIYNIMNRRREQPYTWYQYAPFDIAFDSVLQMINNKTYDVDKISMLGVIITCAKQNEAHINQILKYLMNKLLNSRNIIYDVLLDLISKINFHRLSKETWNNLEIVILKVLHENDNNSQALIQAIIIYKVTHDESIPASIEKDFNFNTLNNYKNKFNEDERKLIFNYLYKLIIRTFEKKDTMNTDEINAFINNLVLAFKLLNDWDKNLKDYPLLLNEVKNTLNLVHQTSAKTDLSPLYNTRKNWKKYMFEESLHLSLNEYTLINAIKHDSSLLNRYHDTKQLTNVNPMMKFLQKLKIYFPSLAADLTVSFQNELHNTANHVQVARGISILYPKTELLKILRDYTPKSPKIIDSDVDRNTLSLQRHFAKTMHVARPQPSPETIIEYAKGDYLQYALPSLLSIFHNLNTVQSYIYVPKLLASQVSLQKHGIRIAFYKLQPQELIESFGNIWKTTKNPTIRYVLIKAVFEKLSKEQDPLRIRDIWKLLQFLLDNLTLEENKAIYDLLFKIDKIDLNNGIPGAVKAAYVMKAYPILKKITVLDRDRYSYLLYITLITYARQIIEHLSPKFVVDSILEFVNEDYNRVYWRNSVIPLLSSYLLCSKDSSTQIQKYGDVLIPILRLSLSNGDNDNKLNKKDVDELLDYIWQDVPNYVCKEHLIFPTQMFAAIQEELEKSLLVPENYIILTKWKLIVAFCEIVQNRKPIHWNESCLEVAEQFGKICCTSLKEHCIKYFSYIYTLFAVALKNIITSLETDVQLEICKGLIHDKYFTEAYVVALKLIPKYKSNLEPIDSKTECLREMISAHPSREVRIHYYSYFEDNS